LALRGEPEGDNRSGGARGDGDPPQLVEAAGIPVTSAFPSTTTRIDAPKTPPNWRALLTTALPVALFSDGRSTVADPMMRYFANVI
jgi:hypothetical protein